MADNKRRAKGEGALRLRGRIWWARFYADERRVEESTGETSRPKAAAWFRARLEDVRLHGGAAVKAGETTLSDLHELLKADYRLKGNKRPDAMEQAVARLRKYLGNPTVAELRHDRLVRYVNTRLQGGAGRGTVRSEMAMVRRMLRLGHRMGLTPMVPPIPMPGEAPARKGFLERHSLETILAELPDYMRPGLRFAYLSGWRFASEVLTLEWRDVDTARGEITLPPERSKNGESRVLPYRAHPELVAIIEGQREATRAIERETHQIVPRVFHRAGEAISPNYHHLWRAACTAAGIPGVLVHDFRRSSTRNLSEAGVSETVVMQLQGHKTRQMFDRYRIVPLVDMATGLGKLAAAGAPIAPQIGRIAKR